MTHEELDRLGPELQRHCNVAIAKRYPTWSRYAADQMLERTVAEIAPGWRWLLQTVIGGCPQIRLTQYNGPVE